MQQDGLIQAASVSGSGIPTEKLLRYFEGGPGEVLLRPKSQFSSYREVLRIFESARTSLTVVDNYPDSTLFEMFESVNDSVELRVLTEKPKAGFQLALSKFKDQYGRSIEVRKHDGKVHDRFVIVDEKDCYSLGTSLNSVGKKLSLLVKLNEPSAIAALLDQFKEIWDGASAL